MNPRTQNYQRYGLHAIRDLDQKAAWIKHLRGETVRLHDLPVNGDHCAEGTIGGAVCGFPILIDGVCPNTPEHGEVEVEVTDAMVTAAFDSFDRAGIGQGSHIGIDDLRAAIAAALRAQRAES